MRLKLSIVLLAVFFPLGTSVCRGDTALFNAYFEQRELVTSIAFDHGSSKLGNLAAKSLETALQQIKGAACDARLIRIEGFSGREGSNEAAFRLSLNRANAVARFLESRGVPCLVGINGYGNLRAGKAAAGDDRRVEIASYPKMFLFDFKNARYVDLVEARLP